MHKNWKGSSGQKINKWGILFTLFIRLIDPFFRRTLHPVEENFKKGMREYQLGNFARARDHFQLVLRDQSNHVLAQRYLYLSRVRFDEVVKSKIKLGQMYYSANNFKLCVSQFQQVKDMLQGRDNDTNLQIADQMFKKCSDAIEGIR